MLGSYVDWRKPQTISHVKVTGQGQGRFSESSRSLGNVMSYSITGSEIPSRMVMFLFIFFYYCYKFAIIWST